MTNDFFANLSAVEECNKVKKRAMTPIFVALGGGRWINSGFNNKHVLLSCSETVLRNTDQIFKEEINFKL